MFNTLKLPVLHLILENWKSQNQVSIMTFPFDPTFNLLNSEPSRTLGRHTFKLRQHLGPSELPASFNPFSNSILPTKVLHKELPSENTFSKSQPVLDHLQPLKSKPQTNPSLSIPPKTSTVLPSKGPRQPSKS